MILERNVRSFQELVIAMKKTREYLKTRFVAKKPAMSRNKEDEQKARKRSSSYVEDFLRNLTKLQAVAGFCSRRWFLDVPQTYLVLVVLMLCSCRSLHPDLMFKTKKRFESSEFLKLPDEYIISTGDLLAIQVFANKGYDLVNVAQAVQKFQNEIEYLVRKDGTIKVPLLGDVNMKGMTVVEAEKSFELGFTSYFKEPFVNIRVINRRVIIFQGRGEGKVVAIENDNTNLIEVLAKAGGIGKDGKAYKIKLIREDPANPGNSQVKIIDLSTIEGIKDAKFLVQANDIIYVEPVFRGFAQVLTEIQPFISALGIITSVLTTYILISNL